MSWKELHLHSNELKVIDPLLVKSVSVLAVGFNFIVEARLKDTKISQLLIEYNKLALLTISETVEILDASDNNQNLFHISFEENKNLKYLDFSTSMLRSKEEMVEKLKSFKDLEYLDLSDINDILYYDTFRGLKKLETLRLSNSMDQRIPDKFFDDLENLKSLDLSGNNFKELDLNGFKHLKKLETLNIRNSKICKLQGWNKINVILPQLKEIDIYRNKFNCKELHAIVLEFRKHNLTLTEFDDLGEIEFIQDSCTDGEIHEKHNPEKTSGGVWKVLTYLVFVFMIIFTIFLVKKFNIVEKISHAIRQLGGSRNSELLESED